MLAGVIYLIRAVNGESVARGLMVMGIESGTSQSPGLRAGQRLLLPGEETLSICRTRVKAILLPNGNRIEELREGVKLTWMAYDPNPREIGYLEVEKWLSQHCQITIVKQTESRILTPGPGKLTLEYISGAPMVIQVRGANEFETGEAKFHSPDLTSALAELGRIAQFH